MNRYRNLMMTATTDYTDIATLEANAKKLKADYAIILHDQDNATAHYHLAMRFNSPTTIQNVAKKLNTEPNFIQKWDNRTDNLWSYLLHNTKEANNTKADYKNYTKNPLKFRTNIPDFIKRASFRPRARALDDYIQQILQGDITEKDLLKPDNLKFYYDNHNKLKKAIQLRTQSLVLNPPNCTTTYIYGLGGTGKTSEARRIAQQLYPNSYALASSPNDLLQDYTGEKCLIIDDFRPQDFEFNYLLALLDPYQRDRTHQSRYFNKPLATELIILTAPISFDEVQNYYQNMNTREDMRQLRRRISTIIHIANDKTLTATVYDDQLDDYFTP